MKKQIKPRRIGILTAGGDCPGLNAAIRGVAKSALYYGIEIIGFNDGFKGLVENRFVQIDDRMVSGILTLGGTILGSSRDKPHKMPVNGKVVDMTDRAVANFRKLNLDCLVCLGGNGTQKNAFRLSKHGIPVVGLPKTIDNDVVGTDICFGFDTAKSIATEAIDRLHTTATSHHRIIAVELMGHSAGWLALGAGIAGGADVILIPEIPYDINVVADFLKERRKHGKRFSIVAVAEGAVSCEEVEVRENGKKKKETPPIQEKGPGGVMMIQEPMVNRIVRQLQTLTGIEARMTELGHVQRGGAPTSTDRLLCTRLGTAAGDSIAKRQYNVMMAIRGNACVAVPMKEVAGFVRTVPKDHEWIHVAKLAGTCFGEK